jgi:hypothetical protein
VGHNVCFYSLIRKKRRKGMQRVRAGAKKVRGALASAYSIAEAQQRKQAARKWGGLLVMNDREAKLPPSLVDDDHVHAPRGESES